MRLDAHRVEQLAAEELEAHDALLGIVGQIFLQQEQVVGLPDRRVGGEDRLHVRERFDDVDARAAAALIRLENSRPSNLDWRTHAALPTSLNVIDHGVSMPSVRSSVACALLLNSSAKTSAPLRTRAPRRSSVRM